MASYLSVSWIWRGAVLTYYRTDIMSYQRWLLTPWYWKSDAFVVRLRKKSLRILHDFFGRCACAAKFKTSKDLDLHQRHCAIICNRRSSLPTGAKQIDIFLVMISPKISSWGKNAEFFSLSTRLSMGVSFCICFRVPIITGSTYTTK